MESGELDLVSYHSNMSSCSYHVMPVANVYGIAVWLITHHSVKLPCLH